VGTNNIREEKVSQLKSFQTNELADDLPPWHFVYPSFTMYWRGFGGLMGWKVGVGWLADDGR
jgi:hypothetical protein